MPQKVIKGYVIEKQKHRLWVPRSAVIANIKVYACGRARRQRQRERRGDINHRRLEIGQ